MRKIICLLLAVISISVTLSAQNKRYQIVSDTSVVKYLQGGSMKGGRLILMANSDYSLLDINRKREILSIVACQLPRTYIVVYVGDSQQEIWLASDAGLFLLDNWDNDNLRIEEFKPLELKRNGNNNYFYYIGGSYSKGERYSDGGLNLRIGTYLYKSLWDVSVSSGMGYANSLDSTYFRGDVGIDSRYYLPWRPPKINLSFYCGAGISWAYAPEKYFEFRALTGFCWLVGPGSIDVGLQYGTQSYLSATLGFTFRPSSIKR